MYIYKQEWRKYERIKKDTEEWKRIETNNANNENNEEEWRRVRKNEDEWSRMKTIQEWRMNNGEWRLKKEEKLAVQCGWTFQLQVATRLNTYDGDIIYKRSSYVQIIHPLSFTIV